VIRSILLLGTLLISWGLALARDLEDWHTWTDMHGNEVVARLAAMDAHRAILNMEDGTSLVVPLSALTLPDQEYAEAWRKRHPDAPLADPRFPYRWPEEAGAPETRIERHPDAGDGHYPYRSEHYIVRSDTDLPNSTVREILSVFEATRAAVMASPLGLLTGVHESRYPVFLYARPESYAAAGGTTGSGGSYHAYTGRMLVLLPNLGINPENPSVGMEYRDRLFVLRHEAVHQLLPPWAWRMPFWLNEGLCEVFASMPYSHHRYRFRDFDHALFEYLRKWEKPNRDDPIPIIRPELLMTMTSKDWSQRVASLSAYDLYNSAALLTHWFLHHDGAGNGTGLIALLAAIREGAPVQEAVEEHLLRGRDPKSFEPLLEQLAQRYGVEIEWVGGWPEE